MTRVSVYSAAVVAFLASTSMIIASIVMPNWVTYSVTTAKGDKIQKQIGLHRTCSTLADPTCQEFPSRDLCQEGERYFCSLWRTAGFMTSFAAILCLATLVAFVVTLLGGKYKRETGWQFISGVMSLVTVVELAVVSMVAYLYDHDGQFAVPGWHLDTSWYMALVSGIVSLLIAVGMAVSAYLLPPEDGYEFLGEPLDP